MQTQKVISQEKGKPEADELHTCFVQVNQLRMDIKRAQLQRIYLEELFGNFYWYFGRLVTITMKEQGLIKTKYGNRQLTDVAWEYINDEKKARKDMARGLLIAGYYLQALQSAGLCTCRD